MIKMSYNMIKQEHGALMAAFEQGAS